MTMQTIRIDINREIFDKVMSFLEIFPKNMIRIYSNEEAMVSNESFNPRDFFGVANSSKVEIDRYLQENQNEWDSYIDKQ